MRGGYFPVVIRAFVGIWFFGIQGIYHLSGTRDVALPYHPLSVLGWPGSSSGK
jgi:hypothetical protein